MLDLVYAFVDLGDPWHKTAATEMLRSAKRVFPSAFIVQLCDAEAKLHPWADAEWRADIKVTKDNYPDFRSFIFTDYLCNTSSPVISSEIDGLWLTPEEFANTPLPDGTRSRDFKHGVYVSFRDVPEKMIAFARALDGGEPFQDMKPTTVDTSHIAGTPDFEAVHIGGA